MVKNVLFLSDFKKWLAEEPSRKQGLEWDEFFYRVTTYLNSCQLDVEIPSFKLNKLYSMYFLFEEHQRVFATWVNNRTDEEGLFYLGYRSIKEIEEEIKTLARQAQSFQEFQEEIKSLGAKVEKNDDSDSSSDEEIKIIQRRQLQGRLSGNY